MRRTVTLLAILLICATAGCVETNTVSFVDPDYRSVRFKRLLVVADMALDHRVPAENSAMAACAAARIDCLRGMDYLPPTRELNGKALIEAMKKAKADVVLVLGMTDSSTKQTYVPPTYHPGETTSTTTIIGNTAYTSTYTSPGYTTGGQTISKPRAKYSAILLEMKAGATVWTATFNSRGNAFVDHIELSKDAAKAAIMKLVADNML